MTDKLAFTPTEPEHVVLPMKMSREKWFEIADRNNDLRAGKMRRCWRKDEIEELYSDLYAA